MKTTVDISDALLETAKRRAVQRGTTLRALIEEGLRGALDPGTPAEQFQLKNATVSGWGLRPEVGEGSWERMSERIHEGRGGWSR